MKISGTVELFMLYIKLFYLVKRFYLQYGIISRWMRRGSNYNRTKNTKKNLFMSK
jgi:hypothetical protein